MENILNKKTMWMAVMLLAAFLIYHAPKIAGAMPWQ